MWKGNTEEKNEHKIGNRNTRKISDLFVKGSPLLLARMYRLCCIYVKDI